MQHPAFHSDEMAKTSWYIIISRLPMFLKLTRGVSCSTMALHSVWSWSTEWGSPLLSNARRAQTRLSSKASMEVSSLVRTGRGRLGLRLNFLGFVIVVSFSSSD